MRMLSSWKRKTTVSVLMPFMLQNKTSTALGLGPVAPLLAAQARASWCTRKAFSHVSMISSHVPQINRFFNSLHCSKLVKVSSAQEHDSKDVAHDLIVAKTNISPALQTAGRCSKVMLLKLHSTLRGGFAHQSRVFCLLCGRCGRRCINTS
jgi:hypothetical protein